MQRGFAQIFILGLLLLGLAAGVYLIQKEQIFRSRASQDPIVIEDSNGNALPKNNSIPYSSSPNLKISLTSTLGSPKAPISSAKTQASSIVSRILGVVGIKTQVTQAPAPAPQPVPQIGSTYVATNPVGPYNSSCLLYDAPAQLSPGQKFTLHLQFRNTGQAPWYSSQGFRSGIISPQDSNIWGPTRSDFSGVINPGQVVNFSINLTAPQTPGYYDLQWKMLQETRFWFGGVCKPQNKIIVNNPGGAIQIPSTPVPTYPYGPYNSACVNFAAPTQLYTGQKFNLSIQMRNTGQAPWISSQGFRLGLIAPQDSNLWGPDRFDFSGRVNPGQTATFNLNLTAPSTPGYYDLEWKMLQELRFWFGGVCAPQYKIDVVQPQPTIIQTPTPIPPSNTPPTPTLGPTYTVSYVLAENKTDLDTNPKVSYLMEPTVIDYTLHDQSVGQHFIWVRFIDSNGKTDDRSQEVDIVAPTPTLTPTSIPRPSSLPVSYLFGKAIQLTGTQYISIPSKPSFNASDNFTIEAWIKPNLPSSNGNYGTIFNKGKAIVGQASYSLNYGSTLNTDGTVKYAYTFSIEGNPNCSGPNLHSDSGTLPNDTSKPVSQEQASAWRHVAVVIKDGNFYLYENGVKVAERTDWKMSSYCNSDSPFQIGAGLYSDNTPSSPFKGQIDEVRVSNIARYSSNFTKPTDPFSSDSNTIGLWHFDGSTIDASSTGNNGQSNGDIQYVDSSVNPTVPSPTPTPATKRIFVTSATYSPKNDFDGIYAADNICQSQASSANLGGTWKAWLSDKWTTPAGRLDHTARFVDMHGAIIANNWAELTSGSLRNIINSDQFGKGVTPLQPFGQIHVWTGTNIYGSLVKGYNDPDSKSAGNCANWHYAQDPQFSGNDGSWGTYGIAGQTNSNWTNAGTVGCNTAQHLYCFEQ